MRREPTEKTPHSATVPDGLPRAPIAGMQAGLQPYDAQAQADARVRVAGDSPPQADAVIIACTQSDAAQGDTRSHAPASGLQDAVAHTLNALQATKDAVAAEEKPQLAHAAINAYTQSDARMHALAADSQDAAARAARSPQIETGTKAAQPDARSNATPAETPYSGASAASEPQPQATPYLSAQPVPPATAPAKGGTPGAVPVPERVDIGVLHGLRALFVLFVCNFHIWQQGWLGQYVTVFGRLWDFDFWTRSSYVFVDGTLLLSGFLLYLPHARRAAYATPVPGAGRFYMNRVARIVPSYLASVLVMLFCVALPMGAYRDRAAMGFDIVTHLTFTFTFFRETYIYTPLNVVLWTVAIEMQFYLLFPLLAKAVRKAPAITLCLMGAAGGLFRAVVAAQVPDLSIWLNQMPAFLDVYALGIVGAIVYVRLDRWLATLPRGSKPKAAVRAAATLLFGLAVYALVLLMRLQTNNSLLGHDQLRLSQWALRLPLAVTLLCLVLAACFLPRLLQKPLDNRLMRFLATISFNLYIWHQALSVLIARGLFPASLHSDAMLQQAFTLLSYAVSIVVAMAATYGLEQPAARALARLIKKPNMHKGETTP